MPEKSGLPSAARGAGADTFGLPSEVVGTPPVGCLVHWAKAVADPFKVLANAIPMAVK